MFKKIALGLFALVTIGTVAFAEGGFWSNWPIEGFASYSCGSVNAVSNCTVPAGPTAVTGNERVPANTNLSGGQSPQNILLSMAALNALPMQVVAVTSSSPAGISASNISGGVLYNSTVTITQAQVTLPVNPIDQQKYVIASNFTITTLIVTAGAGSTLSVSTPTVLTASTTVPQGYKFMYDLASLKWFRIQ